MRLDMHLFLIVATEMLVNVKDLSHCSSCLENAQLPTDYLVEQRLSNSEVVLMV